MKYICEIIMSLLVSFNMWLLFLFAETVWGLFLDEMCTRYTAGADYLVCQIWY